MKKIELEVKELEEINSSLRGKECGFVKAAIQEYMDMMSGERVFSRASDYREYRLLLMIENVFEGMPNETVVADLFQLKRSEARTLINNVDAKYRRRIADTKKRSILGVINSINVENKASYYEFNCDSVYMIESLNEYISSGNELIQKIPYKRNSYKINADTLSYLKSKLK